MRRKRTSNQGRVVYTVDNVVDAKPVGFGEKRLLVLVESSTVADELEEHPFWSGDIVCIPAPPKLGNIAALLFRTGGGPVVHRYSDLTLDWDPAASGVDLVVTERLRLDRPATAMKFSIT